ncbi:hypothetical protein RJ641_013461 [Dillenia turbinata]|uniref:Uncharacterized protein n=1 Tax=Dillenia turbinata TaxID=194707 RepID=A0AAN8ZQI2_9MAGN
MLMVAILAELLEEYTVILARVLEHMFLEAPFPRRVRFLILRRLPFVHSPPLPLPAPHPRPRAYPQRCDGPV